MLIDSFCLNPTFRTADTATTARTVPSFEGVLSFYPQLRKEIDVEYIDFARPRSAIVELLGEENQDTPVLVVGGSLPASLNVQHGLTNDRVFISGEENIELYLAQRYGIGLAH
jgi:hypothetical protein